MIAVIARLKVKKEKTEDAMKLFEQLLENVRKEEGTLYYTLNKDRNDPYVYFVIERYRDEDALQAHSTAPYLAEFFAKAQELLEEGPDIQVLDEIVAK